ncbi:MULTISPECIES: hypothetical protein [unclassified Paenibacillus]|uniref:hypothetical protein n=1 Tax=unclassified Paenibacillus TaxID=185978 RepID=UPI001C1144A8|nr:MULTISPECIES: hypothetical protein [unclassified Paenibacillus]MBU5442930.1 hypothetical protein [Paenibacillus sp. MSJ-34]CAH0119522.1 hypothetical protein PAE9249_02026 [Paenibacillus sp. CECT 9249]
MKHSYLFEEGHWKATGRYYDQEGNQVEVYAETTIRHMEKEWILDGYMELQSEHPVKIFNTYSIDPIPARAEFTTWTSENPALGTLSGKFMMIGDTILSAYVSENGLYSGSECLVKINDRQYANRGFAFHGEMKLSSWEVTLERISFA